LGERDEITDVAEFHRPTTSVDRLAHAAVASSLVGFQIAETAKGFTLVKALMYGRADEVLDLGRSNLRHSAGWPNLPANQRFGPRRDHMANVRKESDSLG